MFMCFGPPLGGTFVGLSRLAICLNKNLVSPNRNIKFLWTNLNYVCRYVSMSTVISSSSSSPSSVEEGSSQTCVGAVPRDLSLYDIISGII